MTLASGYATFWRFGGSKPYRRHDGFQRGLQRPVPQRAAIARDGRQLRQFRDGEAIHLRHVEHGRRTRDTTHAIVIGIIGIGIDGIFLVEDHSRSLLALAHLGAELGPLAIGSPQANG